ncbi:hypothetical protein P7C71_g4197, partial [Lecanoromycetidae sp. Uapishka_2]
MSDSLRPVWCVQRSEDSFVPLIAVDELPESVNLVGVPTVMTMKEMVNAGLACKGEQSSHGKYYQFEVSETDAYSETSQSSHSYSEGTVTPPRKDSRAPGMKGGVANAAGNGKDREKQPKLDEVQIPVISRPTATPGTLGKKVYCTYFLNTGNCNYMQEGCKYKHEFPEDDDTRTAIGLRKLPTWMRDDPAVPVKPITPLPAPVLPPALQQNWRSRTRSQPPQTELGGASKQSNTGPFSRASNAGPRSAHQLQNAFRSHTSAFGPSDQGLQATSAQPSHNNHAQQAPFFAPPGQHFPTHASYSNQQQARTLSSTFGNGNGHAHNSPAVMSADSFSRQIPVNGVSGYHQPTVSSDQSRNFSPPIQAPVGRRVYSMQSSAPDALVDRRQQATSDIRLQDRSTYHFAAPDAHVRNGPVYTPSHTSASQDINTIANAPAMMRGNTNASSTDQTSANNNNGNGQVHYSTGAIGNENIQGTTNTNTNPPATMTAPTPTTYD